MDLCELSNNPNWSVTRHPWERARVKVVADLLKHRFKDSDSTINVLDIGSGDAYLVHQLAGRFPNLKVHCVDIEYTPQIKARLSKLVGDRHISLYASLDEFRSQNPQCVVDVLLLLDVIEHIEDDKGFLKSLRETRTVTADTEVLITVPAHQSLFSAHDVFLKHFRRYTVTGLLDTLRTCGYHSEQSGYFFWSLLIARYLQKTLNIGNRENAQKGISDYKPFAPIDKSMYAVLRLDYIFSRAIRRLGIKTGGLSCYSICRPQKES